MEIDFTKLANRKTAICDKEVYKKSSQKLECNFCDDFFICIFIADQHNIC